MRRANTGHRDANEAAIVAALRAAGAAVAIMAPPMPDLLVEYQGRRLMLEIKEQYAGKTKPMTRNHAGDVPACLTPAQVTWWRAWIAQGGSPPIIVLDADEALAAIAGPDAAAVARVMATTGIDRSGAVRAVVDGRGLADQVIRAHVGQIENRNRELERALADALNRWAADMPDQDPERERLRALLRKAP